jgi:hypothetical protein
MVVLSYSATASGKLCQPWNAVSHAAVVISFVYEVCRFLFRKNESIGSVVDDPGQLSCCVSASEFCQVAD